MTLQSKNGYVKSYKINRIIDNSLMEIPIFVVTLTDDENGTIAPEEFIIFREYKSDNVNKRDNSYLAVSYSNVLQAIIATAKEAFIHREKVIIEYVVNPPGGGGRVNPAWWVGKNSIRSIQIYQ